MEISVSKFELLRELTATQGVVERKTTIPILSNFLFEAANDRLTITATDLDLSLRTSCAAKVKREGACTIPARKLYDYVKLLPDGDISIKLLENHWVNIRSGRSNTKMVGMARANFPGLPVFPSAGSVKIPAQTLRNMIGRTIFAISNEESRYTLNGGLMVLKPESITMVATDGHRLAHIEKTGEQFDVSGENKTLVPKKAMSELTKLSDDAGDGAMAIVAGDDNHLFFQIGHRLLITRKLTGNFPDYERVLPKDHQFLAKLEKGEIRSAIERVAQFADERSRAIRVQFNSGEVRVFSSSVETGESEESVPAEYTGPDIEIGFNAQYLLDFLRAISQDHVAFELKDQKSAGELRPAGDAIADQYRYVVMPMRI